MRTSVIQAATDKEISLTGQVAGTAWQAARPLAVDCWPWYRRGRRQTTTVRLLHTSRALYAQFRCRDLHIFSQVTELNGPVCEDSCVELFACPAGCEEYFNFEANCCGVFHLGVGPGREGRRLIDADLARRIRVATSLAGPTKAESSSDRTWWLAAKLPFDVLGRMLRRRVAPRAGDEWRGNIYRCGGRSDPQYACWSRVDWPHPDYHRPEFFGRLVFA